jgi:hypothetical protein
MKITYYIDQSNIKQSVNRGYQMTITQRMPPVHPTYQVTITQSITII